MARKHDHDIRRGDGWIQERTRRNGTIAYQANWHDGTRKRSKTFNTKDDAEDHLRGVGRLIRAGAYVPDAEITFAESVRAYLERKRINGSWKPTTYATYTTILKNDIAPRIGKVKVVELKASQMQHWIDQLGRQYSPARVGLIRAVATGALREAVRMNIIATNPLAGVEMPKKKTARKETWTADEVTAIMRASEPYPMMHAYYAVALTTGMRPGEIRALMWGDIDFEAGTIIVQRSMTRDEHYSPIVGDSTKTGETRTQRIPPVTVTSLRRLKARQAERRLRSEHWADTGLVFDRGNGHVLPQQTFARRHARMVEMAGVRDLSPHGLRHTVASQLLEAGVPMKVVSDTLGHSQLATTADIYSHVSENLQQTVADTLGALLDDTKSG